MAGQLLEIKISLACPDLRDLMVFLYPLEKLENKKCRLTNLEFSGFDDKVKLGVDVLLGSFLLLHQNSTYRGYRSSYPFSMDVKIKWGMCTGPARTLKSREEILKKFTCYIIVKWFIFKR